MISILSSLLMSIALSACCGFRIFIPLLITSVAIYFNFIIVPSGFAFLGTMPAIILFASASVIEIFAYYFAFIDNALDTIAGPLAIAAGMVLTSGIIKIDNDILRFAIGIVAGGATAGIVQAATTTTRLASSKFTAGFGNGFIATIENITAFALGILSLFLPVLTGIVVCVLLFWAIKKMKLPLFKKILK
jgi:hypothetical protein